MVKAKGNAVCGLAAIAMLVLAPSAPAAALAAAAPAELAPESFVGRWTDTGNCSVTTVLGDDGVFISTEGSRGRWEAQGGELRLSGPGGEVAWRVVFDDPATMRLISADGGHTISTRCGAATTPVNLAVLAGRWTDTDDCANVTVLGEDGIFIAPNGARGQWEARAGRLTLSGSGGEVSWTVYLEDPNKMTLTSADGGQSQSTRC